MADRDDLSRAILSTMATLVIIIGESYLQHPPQQILYSHSIKISLQKKKKQFARLQILC
jgi:hypothetical protein